MWDDVRDFKILGPHLQAVGHHHLPQQPRLFQNAGPLLPRRISVRSHIGGDLVAGTPPGERRDVEEFPPKFHCLGVIRASGGG